ncbi:helix-turn-helix domain-containing protein [Pasteurella testudinis]|uniref:helix-turn-helix domain-containing protein n=1 Tax=Pasteurella testudinis TaxID=761 RepID=UPI004059899B
MAVAAGLLSNTDRTLPDISFASGFQSPSYFDKQFRKQYAITPKRYREQAAA